MTRRADPFEVRHLEPVDGLALSAQSPPASAASAAITFLAMAGAGYDAAGREGSALFTAHAMIAAAGPWRRVELARRIDRLGATLHHHVSPESTEMAISGPADTWPELLEILAAVVLRPRFDPDDVARVARQLRERQMRDLTQPHARAERELLRAIYPRGHPYRETGAGSPRSLDRIGRAQLRRFHREQYVADGALLVTTVPASDRTVRSHVAKAFASLDRSRRVRALRFPAPRRVARPIQVSMPGRSQVDLRLGGPSLPRSAPEFPALYLAHEVLGGRPLLARLFQRVREREGLAYHASSELEAMRYGGYWAVQAGTSPQNWRRALAALREEVDRSERAPPTARELRRVRESVIGELPLALETSADAHELAVDVAYHRLPSDFWTTWPAVLRAVRPESVRDAASVGLDGRRSVTVVAGPIAER